jgi:hypothetical protein
MAMQLELFRSPWAVKFRVMAGRLWKNPWFGWFLIGAFASWYAWWCFQIPSPAKAATVLGFIAAVMVFRGEPEGFEKFFWTIVLFAFLLLEIRAIDHKDHLDELARQSAETRETKSFSEIGEGINKQSRQSQQQFEETVAQQSQDFDETMSRSDVIMKGLGDSMRMQTGGDSFAYVTFTVEPGNMSIELGGKKTVLSLKPGPPAPPQFLVSITSRGKYPLRNVHVWMMDKERTEQAMSEFSKHPEGDFSKAVRAGDAYYDVPYLRPQSREAPSGDVQLLGLYPFPVGDSKDVDVSFSSLNGYWNERLHLRNKNGSWHESLSVMGPTVRQVLHPFIYAEANDPEGRALAEQDWKPMSHTKPPSHPK